jgi:hypothetical protein
MLKTSVLWYFSQHIAAKKGSSKTKKLWRRRMVRNLAYSRTSCELAALPEDDNRAVSETVAEMTVEETLDRSRGEEPGTEKPRASGAWRRAMAAVVVQASGQQ